MTQTVPLWLTILSAVGALLIGLLGRFTLSKKDKKDLEQKNYENSMKIIESHESSYKTYTQALSTYSDSDDPSFDDFMKLASAGDLYFHHAGMMCNAILSGKVDESIRDNTWLPKIKLIFERLLPAHYEVLQGQATKKGYPYTGKMRRQDHESIYAVVEKFSNSPAWQRRHEGPR
ncbi:hypothetical protein [Phenylobacterium koreense]|uniref:DUF4760 domain-containing protein n=1 Tax=Phenylobacterium koreense TaxID=266125 RepID=A0ABV2EHG9_9CAUL